MPTTEEEKSAKPRTRSRKASQQKTAKAGAKAQVLSDQVKLEADSISSITAAIEDEPIEAAAAEVVLDAAPLDVAPETAPVAVALEDSQEEKEEEKAQQEKAREENVAEQMARESALNGEVLPPGARDPAPQAAGPFAIAQAYGDYTRKSWLNGRSLVERLIAMRSLDEAIEIQGEFAKQAYANFLVHSERICGLYSEWAQQVFRPFEKFATGWPRIGR